MNFCRVVLRIAEVADRCIKIIALFLGILNFSMWLCMPYIFIHRTGARLSDLDQASVLAIAIFAQVFQYHHSVSSFLQKPRQISIESGGAMRTKTITVRTQAFQHANVISLVFEKSRQTCMQFVEAIRSKLQPEPSTVESSLPL